MATDPITDTEESRALDGDGHKIHTENVGSVLGNLLREWITEPFDRTWDTDVVSPVIRYYLSLNSHRTLQNKSRLSRSRKP